jgi:hypothetical protein
MGLVPSEESDRVIAWLCTPCRPSATLPKERGPAETVPGRKAETDRVCEGISEGFRLAQSGRVAPRGRSPMAGRGCSLR